MTGTFGGGTPYKDQRLELAQEQQRLANQQQQQGQQLVNPLITGQLPAGQQAGITAALHDALARIRGTFGNLGLGGSTMETSAIDDATLRNLALQGDIERAMASLGVNLESGASSSLGGASTDYSNIAKDQVANDAALMQAITGFGKAMGGGTSNQPGGGAGSNVAGNVIGDILANLGVDMIGA